MVGIAGGIRKRGVGLGDVLVAEYVHYYEPAKMTPGAEQRRSKQYRCDYVLFRKAQNYEASDWKAGIHSARPDGVEGGQPQVHFDPLGCGEQVVADEARIDELLRECPKMVGVAMEGAGVWMGAETTMASDDCRFLEVRGVSDLADAKKADNWHRYAAEAAAAFTAGYLRSKPVWSLGRRGIDTQCQECDGGSQGWPSFDCSLSAIFFPTRSSLRCRKFCASATTIPTL